MGDPEKQFIRFIIFLLVLGVVGTIAIVLLHESFPTDFTDLEP